MLKELFHRDRLSRSGTCLGVALTLLLTTFAAQADYLLRARLPGVSPPSEIGARALLTLGGTGSDILYDIAPDGSGGFVVAGYEASRSGNPQALVARFDENLNLVAQRSLGGAGHDYFQAVTPDGKGGFVAAGYEASSSGNPQALIAHFDKNLNLIVQRSLGGDGSDRFYAVAPDRSGGFVAVGYEASRVGDNQGLIAHFDASLNLVVQRSLGGANSDVLMAVAPDGSGGFITAGYEGSSAGHLQALVVRFNESLNLIGQKSLGSSDHDYFRAITPDGSGGFIAAGFEDSSAGERNALAVRFDQNLNPVVQRSLGGAGIDNFQGIVPDGSGDFMAAGYEGSSAESYQGVIATFPASLVTSGPLANHPNLVFSDPNLENYDPSFAQPVNPGLSLSNSGLPLTDPGFTADDPGLEVLRSDYP
jgi:hypothetical protein